MIQFRELLPPTLKLPQFVTMNDIHWNHFKKYCVEKWLNKEETFLPRIYRKLKAILLLVLLNCVVVRILKKLGKKKVLREKLFASDAKPTWNNETPFFLEGRGKNRKLYRNFNIQRQTSCVSRMRRRNWDDKKCASIIRENEKKFPLRENCGKNCSARRKYFSFS